MPNPPNPRLTIVQPTATLGAIHIVLRWCVYKMMMCACVSSCHGMHALESALPRDELQQLHEEAAQALALRPLLHLDLPDVQHREVACARTAVGLMQEGDGIYNPCPDGFPTP